MVNEDVLPIILSNVDCEVCGTVAKELIVSARDYETAYEIKFDVVRCKKCGLVYTSPRPTMGDLLKYFYGEKYICYQSAGMAINLRERYLCKSRFNNIKNLIASQGRFLDVGCSYGSYLSFLKQNTDWAVYGCEPQKEMADAACKQGLDVKPCVLTDAKYDSNYFDLVYMSHVLEHVPNLKDTVREVFRILKPGGIFITENPDFDTPTRKWFNQCWWGYHLPRHLTHFTHKSISNVLSMFGFVIERIRPCFRPGPIAWSIQNVIKDRKMKGVMQKILSMNNPFLVAGLSPVAAILMMTGHAEMMETMARKPMK